MASALIPGVSGLHPSKTLNSCSASLFTQEYKWVLGNCWGNLQIMGELPAVD